MFGLKSVRCPQLLDKTSSSFLVLVLVLVVVVVAVVVVVVVLFFHLLPLRAPPCVGRGRRILYILSRSTESTGRLERLVSCRDRTM